MTNHPYRKSPRLSGYDYSQDGIYFVTICQHNRLHLFGAIVDSEMKLNAAGEMLFSYWHKLGEKYPFAQVDDFVVMPNHVHGIVVLEHQKGTLPDSTMPDMIGWFKTMTTNAYIRGIDGENWTPFEGKLWQRSFHDHIIRGEKDFLRIQQYIKDNPARWLEDKFYSM